MNGNDTTVYVRTQDGVEARNIALRSIGADYLAETGIRALALDVTDEASMAAAVAQVEAEHHYVSLLVNNAGYALQGPVEDTPIDAVRAQFETNVFGLARMDQVARQSALVASVIVLVPTSTDLTTPEFAGVRLLETLIGIVVALVVNASVLPPRAIGFRFTKRFGG